MNKSDQIILNKKENFSLISCLRKIQNARLHFFLLAAIFLLTTMIHIDDADARRRRRYRPRRAHTLSPEVDLVVTFGDRVTIFQMVKDKKQYYMHFFNSLGQKKDLALSKNNYQYLISQAGAVRGGSLIDDCPRSFVSLETKSGGTVKACLEGDSAVSKKMVELANTYSSVL
jgi:hypothetical protein